MLEWTNIGSRSMSAKKKPPGMLPDSYTYRKQAKGGPCRSRNNDKARDKKRRQGKKGAAEHLSCEYARIVRVHEDKKGRAAADEHADSNARTDLRGYVSEIFDLTKRYLNIKGQKKAEYQHMAIIKASSDEDTAHPTSDTVSPWEG